MRTLLCIYVEQASDPLTSVQRGNVAVSVEEAQETLSGLTVYHGTAAYTGTKPVDGPFVTEDDDGNLVIEETEHVVRDPRSVEFIAVPEANPGFAAFDTSDNRFARNLISMETGGWLEPAIYETDRFTDYLQEQYSPAIEQVGWEDGDETGVFYPDEDNDDGTVDVTRAVRKKTSQIGFRYFTEDDYVRGTLAGSGYCNIYSSDAPVWMAQFLRTELLQFAGVPDIGRAEDIATGEADFTLECADCGTTNALREVAGGDILCPDCEQAREEDDEETTDDAQQTLEETGETDVEECESCGREPEYGLEEASDGREVCLVCKDDIDNRGEA